jgi:hypothetical protein
MKQVRSDISFLCLFLEIVNQQGAKRTKNYQEGEDLSN